MKINKSEFRDDSSGVILYFNKVLDPSIDFNLIEFSLTESNGTTEIDFEVKNLRLSINGEQV